MRHGLGAALGWRMTSRMNLPNQLTVARDFLAATLPRDDAGRRSPSAVRLVRRRLSLALPTPRDCSSSSLASVTDYLDGAIARRRNLITDFGKLMDPLGGQDHDGGGLHLSGQHAHRQSRTNGGAFPAWVAIIIISREFLITGLRLLAASKGVIIAGGKTRQTQDHLADRDRALLSAAAINLGNGARRLVSSGRLVGARLADRRKCVDCHHHRPHGLFRCSATFGRIDSSSSTSESNKRGARNAERDSKRLLSGLQRVPS